MGSDNFHHRRKARKANELGRRRAKREPYDKVLIVCEGSKSEPKYFEDLKNYYELSSANIEITGECGSSPINVWEYAYSRYTFEKNAGDAFNRVYCVFDKDSHQSYADTCDRILHAKPKNTFFAITSVPCFEYWLLLHFICTTKPYNCLPNNSAGNQLLNELKTNYMPDYEKGATDTFKILFAQLDVAKTNARRSRQIASAQHTDNPTTNIDELVEYLQSIK